jgi:hypothetical protein
MKINKIFLITIIIYSVSAVEEEKQNATGYHKLISDFDSYCKNTLRKEIETKSLFESIKQLTTLNAQKEKQEKKIVLLLPQIKSLAATSYSQEATKSAELNYKLLTCLFIPGLVLNSFFGVSLTTGKLDTCIKALGLDNYNKVKVFGILSIINIIIFIAQNNYKEIKNIETVSSCENIINEIGGLQGVLDLLKKEIEINKGVVNSFKQNISLRDINFMEDLNKVFQDNGYSISLIDAVKETEEWKAALQENNLYPFYSFLTTLLFTQPGDEDAKRLIQHNLGIREHIGVDYKQGTLFPGTIGLWGDQSNVCCRGYYQEIDDYFNNNTKDPKKNCNFVFYGIPGVGKSQMVRNIIIRLIYRRDDVTVFEISNTAIASLADVDSLIASIEEKLLNNRKIIIMIDEIEGIVLNRDHMKSNDPRNTIVNRFLQMIDGYAVKNVVFLATTNYIGRIDDAFQRHGRFTSKRSALPDYDDRRIIISGMLSQRCFYHPDKGHAITINPWAEDTIQLFNNAKGHKLFGEGCFLRTYSNLLAMLCVGHTHASMFAIINSFFKYLDCAKDPSFKYKTEVEPWENSEEDLYKKNNIKTFPTYSSYLAFMHLYDKTKRSDDRQNKEFINLLKEFSFNAVSQAQDTEHMIRILQYQAKRLDAIYPGTITYKERFESYNFQAFDKIPLDSFKEVFLFTPPSKQLDGKVAI